MVEWGGKKFSELNREWIPSSKSCGPGSKDSPRKSGMLRKNAFRLLPWPFRHQVSNSCSSFLSLKRSYHLPYVTDPDWSPSGCCKTCFCCAQGEIKCIWEHISPTFSLPRAALHLLPGAVERLPWTVPAPRPSSTGNGPLDICSEYLTVYLDIFKVVNYTHHQFREKSPAFFSGQLMGRGLSWRCSDEQNAQSKDIFSQSSGTDQNVLSNTSLFLLR